MARRSVHAIARPKTSPIGTKGAPYRDRVRRAIDCAMHGLRTALLGAMCVGPCGAPAAPGGHGPHGAHEGGHAFADANALSKVFDDPSRDEWQRPDDVIRALELTPSMVVADVGAGTGYFAVRLARALPRGEVIATDLEPSMVRFLTERAHQEELHNLRAIAASPTASGLASASVDRILIVHVWHHLAGRVRYARDWAAALRADGRLFIVDFQVDAVRGPPANLRVTPEQLIAELAAAGLQARVSSVVLPDQYIIEAYKGTSR